jgi:hypothetical protein
MPNKTKIVEKKGTHTTRPNSHREQNDSKYDKIVFYAKDKLNDPWVTYKFNEQGQKNLQDQSQRDSYEDFVYGYLYHYDMVLRNGGEPHSLAFYWEEYSAFVNIYIDPPHKKATSMYSKIQDFYDKDEFNPQLLYKDEKNPLNWLSVPSSIDPTPPPPPPPPPMY